MSRQEDFEKAAMDYCEDHSHCIYFEFGAEHGYQYAQTHPNWISVEDELPRVGFGVLCYSPDHDDILKCALQKMLSPKHARQIYDLYRFLRQKLTKEEIAKLANCDGQAVEIGLKERCQDDLYEH